MVFNLFISPTKILARGSLVFVERFAVLPKGAYEFFELIASGSDGIYFTWATDESVNENESADIARFGGSRYNVTTLELARKPTLALATLEELGEHIKHGHGLADYEFSQPLSKLISKARDLYMAFAADKIVYEVLDITYRGSFAAAHGFHRAEFDEYHASLMAARVTDVPEASVKGISYTKIAEALSRDSRSNFHGMRWWGTIVDQPRMEFFGRTKLEVQHLVAIHRAAEKRYNELML